MSTEHGEVDHKPARSKYIKDPPHRYSCEAGYIRDERFALFYLSPNSCIESRSFWVAAEPVNEYETVLPSFSVQERLPWILFPSTVPDHVARFEVAVLLQLEVNEVVLPSDAVTL